MGKDLLNNLEIYIKNLIVKSNIDLINRIEVLEKKNEELEASVRMKSSTAIKVKYLNRNQISEMCNVHSRTVVNWCNEGLIEGIKKGRNVIYDFDETIKRLNELGKIKKGSVI